MLSLRGHAQNPFQDVDVLILADSARDWWKVGNHGKIASFLSRDMYLASWATSSAQPTAVQQGWAQGSRCSMSVGRLLYVARRSKEAVELLNDELEKDGWAGFSVSMCMTFGLAMRNPGPPPRLGSGARASMRPDIGSEFSERMLRQFMQSTE